MRGVTATKLCSQIGDGGIDQSPSEFEISVRLMLLDLRPTINLERNRFTAMKSTISKRAAAAIISACFAAGANAQSAAVSYIACEDKNIYRVGSGTFSEWDSKGQVWDEKCFAGERRSRGGSRMLSVCNIDQNEVRSEITFFDNDGSPSVVRWTISRRSGRMSVFNNYGRNETEYFQCRRTDNPDQGQAIF